jgi:hypothetical protein
MDGVRWCDNSFISQLQGEPQQPPSSRCPKLLSRSQVGRSCNRHSMRAPKHQSPKVVSIQSLPPMDPGWGTRQFQSILVDKKREFEQTSRKQISLYSVQ